LGKVQTKESDMDIKATLHLADSDIIDLIHKFGGAKALKGIATPALATKDPPPGICHDHTDADAQPNERKTRAAIRMVLSKYRHIIPVDRTTSDIYDAINGVTIERYITSQQTPRGRHSRSGNRIVVKGLSLARSVASHWQPPNPKIRFTRVDAAQWLRETGHNPSSASAVLSYLEGAGIVVAIGRVISGKKGDVTRKIIYTWGRRMRDDEDIHCHGPTGILNIRDRRLPVMRHV
jgi:hypothetical protein